MAERVDNRGGIAAFLLFLLLALATFWWTEGRRPDHLVALTRRPAGIMGTECRLVAVVPRDREPRGRRALTRAEEVVRRLEARLSIHLDSTPLARFNRAPAHRWVELGEETVRLLERARRLSRATGGAFDITCGPQVALWRQAGKENRLPTPAQVEAARARSGWELLELAGSRARKGAESLALDLGGIAKGEAIDRALAVLAAAGCAGGLVEIGGDLRCFGRRPGGRPWEILVRDPYRPGESCASLELGEGALCTSGDYFRYTEIEGRRYSHILDPRTGRPAGQASSVTVLAPRAVVADAWATALSVLGPEGLDRVESRPGLEALMIVGGPGRSRHLATSGFPPTTGPE